MKKIVLSSLAVLLAGLVYVQAKPTRAKKQEAPPAPAATLALAPTVQYFKTKDGQTSIPVGYLVVGDNDKEQLKASIHSGVVLVLRADGLVGWAPIAEVAAQLAPAATPEPKNADPKK